MKLEDFKNLKKGSLISYKKGEIYLLGIFLKDYFHNIHEFDAEVFCLISSKRRVAQGTKKVWNFYSGNVNYTKILSAEKNEKNKNKQF